MCMMNKIDELLTAPCYLIDLLPQRVGRDEDGQYFALEEYYLEDENRMKLFETFANMLLKLNCYYDFQVSFHDVCTANPSPKQLFSQILQCAKEKTYMNIIIEKQNALLTVGGDDLYVAVYNPNLKMLKILSQLTAAAGMFFRKSAHQDIHDYIAKELLENHSVSAFIWLIHKGRELEFRYRDTNCFVSKSNSTSNVSLWIGDLEQGFASVEALWSDAIIDGHLLADIWGNVTFDTLF